MLHPCSVVSVVGRDLHKATPLLASAVDAIGTDIPVHMVCQSAGGVSWSFVTSPEHSGALCNRLHRSLLHSPKVGSQRHTRTSGSQQHDALIAWCVVCACSLRMPRAPVPATRNWTPQLCPPTWLTWCPTGYCCVATISSTRLLPQRMACRVLQRCHPRRLPQPLLQQGVPVVARERELGQGQGPVASQPRHHRQRRHLRQSQRPLGEGSGGLRAA